MPARSSLWSLAVLVVIAVSMFFAVAAAAVYGLAVAGWWVGKHAVTGGQFSALGLAAGGLLLVAAAVVAWSLLPRGRRFTPPGPEVTPRTQPALFEELRRVARATGEPVPLQVYLYGEANAFVTEHGGVLGFGSRRVMAIGLPLLCLLTVAELRAVLAHEMGHFHGGDTRVWPWICRAHALMSRTAGNLARAGERAAAMHRLAGLLFSAVRLPFGWLAGGFLWISQAVSREQERAADAVAIRAAGAAAWRSGLRKASGAGLAYWLYREHEIDPLIEHGVLPPLGEGFLSFLRGEPVQKLLGQWPELEAGGGGPRHGDASHPPMRERLAVADRAAAEGGGAAEEASGAEEAEAASGPAFALLVEPDRYDTEPLAKERGLRRVSWRETGAVWAKIWRLHAKVLEVPGISLTVGTVPSTPLELRVLMRKAGQARHDDSEEHVRRWAGSMVGSAIAAAAAEAGYAVEHQPGGDAWLVRDGRVFDVFGELAKYLAGERTPGQWRAWCEELGIAALPLGRRGDAG